MAFETKTVDSRTYENEAVNSRVSQDPNAATSVVSLLVPDPAIRHPAVHTSLLTKCSC